MNTDSTPLYCHNTKCQAILTGRQTKFCSKKCKALMPQNVHQNYQCQKERGVIRKLQLMELMGGGCSICGYNGNLAAIDLHHTDPSKKELEINLRSLSNNNWDFILREASKCKLLCANCHRAHHHPTMDVQKLKQSISEHTDKKPVYLNVKKYTLCETCGTKLCINGDRCRTCSRRENAAKGCVCECGKSKSKRAKTCQDCYVGKLKSERADKMNYRIVDRPSMEILQTLIWQKPLSVIGEEYGVSGNAIKKWCRRYGIAEFPGTGYWAKIDAGQLPKIAKLN